MYRVVKKRQLASAPRIVLLEVEAPAVAAKVEPGQFVIVRLDEKSERIPLTVMDFDRARGTITIVIQEVGYSSAMINSMEEGSYFLDFVGPLGVPSEIENYGTVVCIGGGLGVAPVYPIARALKEAGNKLISIIGARSADILILEEEMAAISDELVIATDDGSKGIKGFVTNGLEHVLAQGTKIDAIWAIGPVVMMRSVANFTRPLGIKTIVSMNPIMVDGTGMCGACRVSVGNETKFACVDGPEFDGHLVDFDLAIKRLAFYKDEEERAKISKDCDCGKGRNNMALKVPRHPMPCQDPKERAHNFNEVALGYPKETAVLEAQRCLQCKKPKCVEGCPVNISIPEFIHKITEEDFEGAAAIIKKSSSLPAVCGRVCPQESQCEAKCVLGIKGEPVAIGRLERFVADYEMSKGCKIPEIAPPTGKKVAIIGAGPAGLACAGDLAKYGHKVTVFEALHVAGGVLMYGIPEFRLPKHIVQNEICNLEPMGVEILVNQVVGKVTSVHELLKNGYDAVFIGTGAGLPYFMGIPGENLNGVYSANEFLTRTNLMKGYLFPEYKTPVKVGKKVAVFGAGNVAMDAARTALRLGAEEVTIVYRRSRAEMPARHEEVEHAEEEGIKFQLLTNPVAINGDEKGAVKSITCLRYELGEPDASGRRAPVPIPGSEFDIEVDTVVVAIGQGPNPLVTKSTEGLELNKRGNIVVNEETLETSIPGVFAGGDIVTGAATVILAMGAGKKAAAAINEYLKNKS